MSKQCNSDREAIRAQALDRVFDAEERVRNHAFDMLDALQLTYRKHHMGDDSIGWDYLSDTLCNVLCNAMGDGGYQQWLKEMEK